MKITQNEIDFILFMEAHVLPNRRNIGYETLIKAGSYVGIPINTACRSCAQKSGMDLLNRYGQLKPAYLEYLEEQKKLEEQIIQEVYTQYTAEIVKADEEPIITDEMGHIKDVEVIIPEVEISETYRPLEVKPKTFPKKKK